ncbi:MAG TPA: hypothetical protein VF054_12735 [Micromonosporaceae bacterium]
MAINMDDPQEVTAEFHAIMRANRVFLINPAHAAAARSRVLARLVRDGLITEAERRARMDEFRRDLGLK